MIFRVLAVGAIALGLFAQTPPPDIDAAIRDVRSAINKGDLTAAADLAVKLDDTVQQQFREWLNRDAGQRIDEVLTWLPEDTETLMVYQVPFVINAKDSAFDLEGHPARLYSTDRLKALNGGKLYSALAGAKVRLVAVGERRILDRSSSSSLMTPAFVPNAEVVYLYFLADAPDASIFGEPDRTIEDRPAWLGTATVDAGTPIGTRERRTREDKTWLTLANPTLLMMSNSPELMALILQRIAHGSHTRALPGTLPEWAEVDRKADFWALRHYSDPGDGQDTSNPRSNTIEPGQRDPMARGVTVQFYAETRDLEIRYLSGAAQLPRFIDGPPTPQFKEVHVRAGLWRATSNIRERGDYPFHVAAGLLGFGEYH